MPVYKCDADCPENKPDGNCPGLCPEAYAVEDGQNPQTAEVSPLNSSDLLCCPVCEQALVLLEIDEPNGYAACVNCKIDFTCKDVFSEAEMIQKLNKQAT